MRRFVYLLSVGDTADVVIDGLTLLLVDSLALLLVHCPAGRGLGLTIPRLGRSCRSLTRRLRWSSVAGAGSVGGAVTTTETKTIRTSLRIVLDRLPPTLLSQAKSQ